MAVRKYHVFVPGNMFCCIIVFPIVAHNALTSVTYLSPPYLCTAFKIALHSFCGNSLCGLMSQIQWISLIPVHFRHSLSHLSHPMHCSGHQWVVQIAEQVRIL